MADGGEVDQEQFRALQAMVLRKTETKQIKEEDRPSADYWDTRFVSLRMRQGAAARGDVDPYGSSLVGMARLGFEGAESRMQFVDHRARIEKLRVRQTLRKYQTERQKAETTAAEETDKRHGGHVSGVNQDNLVDAMNHDMCP